MYVKHCILLKFYATPFTRIKDNLHRMVQRISHSGHGFLMNIV